MPNDSFAFGSTQHCRNLRHSLQLRLVFTGLAVRCYGEANIFITVQDPAPLIPFRQEFHWKKVLRANHLFILVAKVLANPAVCLSNDVGSIPNNAALLSRCIEIRISQT